MESLLSLTVSTKRLEPRFYPPKRLESTEALGTGQKRLEALPSRRDDTGVFFSFARHFHTWELVEMELITSTTCTTEGERKRLGEERVDAGVED